MRQLQQPIGLSAHGGQDDDDLVAIFAGMLNTIGHSVNSLNRPDGSASVFLDNQGHEFQTRRDSTLVNILVASLGGTPSTVAPPS